MRKKGSDVFERHSQSDRDHEQHDCHHQLAQGSAFEQAGDQPSEDNEPGDPEHEGKEPQTDRERDSAAEACRRFPKLCVEMHDECPGKDFVRRSISYVTSARNTNT